MFVVSQGMASVPQLEALLKQVPVVDVDMSDFTSKLKQVRISVFADV